MDLGQFQRTYFEECAELLAEIEERLLAISAGDVDEESLHALFRAVHSIKGGAGAFGFDQLVSYAHVFETLLDAMRDGRVPVNAQSADVLIAACDILQQLVHAAQSNADLPEDYGADVSRALEALTKGEAVDFANNAEGSAGHIATDSEKPPEIAIEGEDFGLFVTLGDDKGDSQPESEDLSRTGDDTNGNQLDSQDTKTTLETVSLGAKGQFRITFAPAPDMFRKANEPLLLIRELLTLGLLRVHCFIDDVPSLPDLDAEGAYLNWRIDLTTDATIDEIKEVFEFVEDDCHLTILPLYQAKDGEFFVDSHGAYGLWQDPELYQGDDIQNLESPITAEGDSQDKNSEQDLGKSGLITPPSLKAPAESRMISLPSKTQNENGSRNLAQRGQTTIRVDLDKIDRLVNMVGEIVITQAMLKEQVNKTRMDQSSTLLQGVEELSQHTRELQEAVMAIRAQPVKSVFARMARLVHDVAPGLGKDVKLTISGEATEVDKTVIEQLSDPLTHMIRNSIDHGVETPEVREANGKPRQGVIHLSAGQRGGRIVIEVEDDGAGLNRKRIRQKAEEKGLIFPNTELNNEQLDNLIFMPGFSTAETVSDISGRGVGMDVVKRNIQNLGGRITVQGDPGRGTKFVLTLPLTLAVLDGMIVRVGDETYVLPLSSIIETIRPSKQDIHQLVNNSEMLSMRGEFLPIIYLSRIFSVNQGIADATKGLVVIVDVEGGNRVGLVIDELMGQQQVVIKSLESNYRRLEGISGATILGDGRVSLILDPASISVIWEEGQASTKKLTQSYENETDKLLEPMKEIEAK